MVNHCVMPHHSLLTPALFAMEDVIAGLTEVAERLAQPPEDGVSVVSILEPFVAALLNSLPKFCLNYEQYDRVGDDDDDIDNTSNKKDIHQS